MRPGTTEEALALLIADVFEAAGAFRQCGDALAGGVRQTQSRWQVLSVVSDGDWTVAAAARRLGVSRQAVQKVANALARDGLVVFETNPADRRAPRLRLTSSGREALVAITTSTQAWHTRLGHAVSVQEIERARRLLRTLTARAAAAVTDVETQG